MLAGKRNRDFWVLYILGWGVFASAYAAVHFFADGRTLAESLQATGLVLTPAVLLGVGVFFYADWLARRTPNRSMEIAAHFLSALVYPSLWIASIWSMRMTLIFLSTGEFKPFFPPEHVLHWHFLSGATVYVLLVAVNMALDRAQARWQAEKDAEIRVALAKFDPHFLFNTLNAIRRLIEKDPTRAVEAHSQLAVLLRRSIVADKDDAHSLGKELELCRTYLDLQRLRLGDRLRVEWEVDKAAQTMELPSLILQPLLENAVRHGLEPLENGGALKIAARKSDARLSVEITNTAPSGKQSVKEKTSPGIGLSLVRARLRAFDPDAIMTAQKEKDRFSVVMRFQDHESAGV